MENESCAPHDVFNFALDCKKKGQTELARALFEDVLNETDDARLKGRCFLALGQFGELGRGYELALDFYEKGLALQTTEKFTDYFLNNNAAYCLNLLGRHREAEALCRKAIEIDPSRHNAWKNLGLSLEALGDPVGAASAYIAATKIAPDDPRAFVLLQRLIEANPNLQTDFPGIVLDKAACLEAITAAIQPQARSLQTSEICRLKHIPGTGYFEQKEGVERPILFDELMEVYGLTALGALDNYPNIWVAVAIEGEAEIAQQKATSTESSDLTPCVFLRRDRVS